MEQIISASGVQHGLIVTPEGAIPISGTISATAVEESIGRPDQAVPLSGTLIMGASGGTSRILLTDEDGILQTSASLGVGSVVTSGVSTVTGSITIYDSRTGSVGVVGSIEV